MKGVFFKNLVMAGGIVALAACGGEPEAPADVDPDMMPGVTVANGRLVLPAVAGNPAAVYFDVSYEGERPAMIRRVDVAGTENAILHESIEQSGVASMHEILQVPVPSGETLKFEPGGKHVMAMDVDSELEAGDTVEVTITFVGGDKASFAADVRGPGEGD